MTRLFRSFRTFLRDRRGVSALEFALIAPILFATLLGIAALGILFLAKAGLRNTVEDAARYATTWPRPSQAQIQARIASHQFGMDPANIVAPTVTFDTSSLPNYVIITMGYNINVNYLVGSQTVALTETRRAYVTS